MDWVRALSRWIPAIEAADPAVADCLIIQGEEDRTVDWPVNLDILQEKFPDAEIHRYPIARHHLVNERADIREQWMAALRRYLT